MELRASSAFAFAKVNALFGLIQLKGHVDSYLTKVGGVPANFDAPFGQPEASLLHHLEAPSLLSEVIFSHL